MPAASVYRHVGRLAEAGVLHVVAERRVRGITERTYTLRLFAAQMQPGEVAAMSLEEHAQRVPRPTSPGCSATSTATSPPSRKTRPETGPATGSPRCG